MLIGPQEVCAVPGLELLLHLPPGKLLLEEVAGDLDIVAEDHGGIVAALSVVGVLRYLPEFGESGPHTHQLYQGPARQIQFGRVNIGEDLLSYVSGA